MQKKHNNKKHTGLLAAKKAQKGMPTATLDLTVDGDYDLHTGVSATSLALEDALDSCKEVPTSYHAILSNIKSNNKITSTPNQLENRTRRATS